MSETDLLQSYKGQLLDLVRGTRFRISDLKPSEWTERHRVLTSDITNRPGPFRYSYTPYCREIVDCLSPHHPAKNIAVRKGAQIGFSRGVIESGIGYIIAENPGNILFLTGHADLTEIAMNKNIDQMIDSCGLRQLIRPTSGRVRNQRTGDTKKGKEFPGGSLVSGAASNHKILRQLSVKYGFIDDFDSIKKSSVQSGSSRKLIEKRFAAYADTMKLFWISTPELKRISNIDEVFVLGDQRYYNVPCPCCGEMIPLLWNMELEDKKQQAGIVWKVDNAGRLIENSVGYVCQSCAGFFDETMKTEMLLAGRWIPTAEPTEEAFYSYQISSLYAPAGHFNWNKAVRDYIEANPQSGRREDLYKVFVNTILGESYELTKASPDANKVQSNVRSYKIGSIPEWTSEKDGNGRIVMLTCACDLNGTEEDARLDYEVVAWSESGSSYSVKHGSIGTFVYRENEKRRADREKWTYNHNRTRSVWPELEKILKQSYQTDTGRDVFIMVTGVDCGHYTNQAYAFIDGTHIAGVFGIKGDKEEKFRKYRQDMPLFKKSRERNNMYLFDVNYIKDLVADCVRLTWDSRSKEIQPPGYMNYPQPADGLYGWDNFFKHYEAEHRTDDVKDGITVGTRWVKKNSNLQNHFWDVYTYNFGLKEMWAALVLQEAGKKGTWPDYVKYLLYGE